MGKPTAQQTWVGVIMMALTILSSYLGYDKYEQVQAAKAEAPTVTVNVESMPETTEVLSRIDVETLIGNAIKVERSRNTTIYKKLEPWEKN